MVDWGSALVGAGFTALAQGQIHDFISRALGGTVPESVDEFLTNEIRRFDAKRTAEVFAQVYQKVQETGVEINTIQTKLLIPILENISWEDDDFLRQKWTNLLYSEITGNQLDPIFIQILNQMTASDAKLFDKLSKENEEKKFAKNYIVSEEEKKSLEKLEFFKLIDIIQGNTYVGTPPVGIDTKVQEGIINITQIGHKFYQTINDIS